MTTPLVHQLKVITGAAISWAIDAGIAPLLEGHPDVDELLLFPRDPFQPSSAGAPAAVPQMARLARKLRKRRFDLAIDLQGLTRSYALLQWSRATEKIGRGRFPFLRRTLPHRRDLRRHAVERTLDVLDLLGFDRPHQSSVVLPFSRGRQERVKALLGPRVGNAPIISLIPGTSWASKRWPAEYWAEAINRLANRGYTFVLVGSRGEAALGDQIRKRVCGSGSVIEAFGLLTLGELPALFASSSLVIGGDTGPLHIAAATSAPILGLYAASDPRRTSPWPPGRAELLVPPGCRHCLRPRCGQQCMQRLTSDVVVSRAIALIDGAGSPSPTM